MWKQLIDKHKLDFNSKGQMKISRLSRLVNNNNNSKTNNNNGARIAWYSKILEKYTGVIYYLVYPSAKQSGTGFDIF